MSGVTFPPIAPRSAPTVSSSEPQRAERAVGGKATRTPKVFKTAKSTAGASTQSYALALHKSRKDPRLSDQIPISEMDLERGVASMLERGLVPHGFSVDSMISGGGPSPISSMPAPLHKHTDQFKRADVMTTNLGFGSVISTKIDFHAIEQIPAKASYAQLVAAKREAQLHLVETKPRPPPKTSDPAPEHFNVRPLDSSHELSSMPVKERDDARTYAELLDLYSLHEFIIRRGRTLRNTPEFVSFKRSYSAQWGSIETVIEQLEDLLTAYGVNMVYIDGKRVMHFAVLDQGILSKEELMSCIANRQEVEPQMASVVVQYQQGLRGHHVAATKLQSVWKMYRERKRYGRLRIATAAAVVIQRQWVIHRAHMKTRRLLTIHRDALSIQWKDTMERFLRDWPRIREGKRVVLHIPSLSLPSFQCKQMPFFDCFQAAQMMRLADLRDRNVEIILLAPFKLEKETFAYYLNVLKAAGAENPEGRVCLIVPENNKRLPPGLSLTKMVLMSSKTMKLLQSLVRGKQAYIVPGLMGPEEHTLACRLNLPLFAAEPKVAQVLATKSGGKTILEAAEVATPVGAYHIKNTNDLFIILARFMVEYRDVSRWLVKIDSESGSRGHAVFDTSRIRCLTEQSDIVTTDMLLKELTEHAAKRVKILHTSAYPEWGAYADVFNATGGCVEAVPSRVMASPTANLYVEPDGTVHLLSVVENVCSPQLSVLGCSFPQTASNYEGIRDAALSVAHAAFRRRVIGYMSVDFVVYERLESNNDRAMRLWAVDFDLYWTTNSCMHQWVMLLTGATFDAESGRCLMPQAPTSSTISDTASASSVGGSYVPLTYVYSGLVYNSYIGAIRHTTFFSHCRQAGLSFDVKTRTGLAFHLVDTLLKGCFGAVAIGASMSQCVGWLHDIQQLVQAELPKDADSIAESNYSYFVSAVKHLLTKSTERKVGESVRKRMTK
ncbi:IQ calmodulin-binding protein, putative [Bodo saltans]|uniref:IQ calmodulin-binding protein, putative n=1 Tax=Bodo saltans TaxID=75058 RepID=A0A0S4KP46_BODSA|nr:IQ calmodulin-binding protein, putative [Bodo saltans]|eukprot:CUI15395.1 IQ calmodulin-binding protein, putative [Bodo saltans]